MSGVELLDGGLNLGKAGGGFAQTKCVGIGSGFGCKLSGAEALELIDLPVERADIEAQALLLGDARLELIEIERNEAGAGSGQGLRERTEQSDALFKKFEV